MEGEKDIIPWLVLNRFSMDNLAGWTELWKKFGSAERIFNSDWDEVKASGLKRQSFQKIARLLPSYREEAEKEAELSGRNGVGIVTLGDERYPALLRQIYDPPFVLYCRGDISVLSERKGLAVVGSRMASIYGRNTARRMARDLAAHGLLVVSGGAAGIDTEAHIGALEAGLTAAVLGSGIDVAYPRENAGLFGKISERGVVISEFPFGTSPDRYNFPRRNRIISGLSYGVVVVEAAKRSGSLITANFALDQDRELFAVPGEIGAHFSEGTNNLIKQGAKLVESALDILEALEFERPRPVDQPPAEQSLVVQPPAGQGSVELSELEKAILVFLGGGIRTVDAILNELAGAGHQVKEVESALLMLELKDRVRQEIGKRFKKT